VKITDLKAYIVKGEFTPDWPSLQHQVNALMYYDEYQNKTRQGSSLDP
jgi:hypothetical protein